VIYVMQSLNIEPENVAMYGVSAGAGASLWLGTHDELADAEAEDPILRESTRIKAVGALVTQSTYDIIDWEEVLLPITQPVEAILGRDADTANHGQVIPSKALRLTHD